MTKRICVLITGASGLIGSVLRARLEDQYSLRGIDKQPSPKEKSLAADTSYLEGIAPAFNGVDTVVDLAAVPDQDASWQSVYSNNIPSTYNVLEASRLAGVKRVVFASSNHVTGLYETDRPYSDVVAGHYDGLDPTTMSRITTGMPIRPDGPYGIAKAFGEAAGRYYSEQFGLSVACLRIGSVIPENRPMNTRHFATLLTHDDLAQLVARCIDAPDDMRFSIFYGVSGNYWRIHDIENAKEILGYKPKDNADTWR